MMQTVDYSQIESIHLSRNNELNFPWNYFYDAINCDSRLIIGFRYYEEGKVMKSILAKSLIVLPYFSGQNKNDSWSFFFL